MRQMLFRRQERPTTTLGRRLGFLLAGLIVPYVLMTGVFLYTIDRFNSQYTDALQNANTAGEFNNDFKKNLDQKMYYYVIGSSNIDHLPLEDVEEAREVLRRLQQTTTLKENEWRIRSMLNLCDRLSECMVDIAGTQSYDERQDKLEKNVDIITALIQSYMHDYTYDEVRELSILQQKITNQVYTTVAVTVLAAAGIVVFLALYSWRFARGITRPIYRLCDKVERLGRGSFAVEPIITDSRELKTLDDGFNEMAERISSLLRHVREDQDALRRAEMELLQAQINPHFLYNTFDSIIWLAETHKDEEVVQIVTSLSSFFRNSLSKGQDIITLETEQKQVCSYLEIQQIRYRDVLSYQISIPEDLLGCYIPKLTLQPLVENAIYHGIRNKRGGGTITVTGRAEGGDILLKVEDNGAGMTPGQLEELRAGIYKDGHTGLGLVNVHRRLRLYCGEGYGLSFESRLGEGTRVLVRIPKQNRLLPKKIQLRADGS